MPKANFSYLGEYQDFYWSDYEMKSYKVVACIVKVLIC